MAKKLTKCDIDHLRDELRAMWDDDERREDGGPDDVMTSIGYVWVFPDGEVIADGTVLGQFDDDLDYTDERGKIYSASDSDSDEE